MIINPIKNVDIERITFRQSSNLFFYFKMTEKEVYSNDNTSIIADEMEFPTEAMTRLLTNINASIQEEMNDLKFVII